MTDIELGDEVSAERAIELVATGSVWMLDVREDHEWQAGHAVGAHHISMYDLDARQDELPEADPILVICHVGGRSRIVTDALRRAGYPASNVAGGMDAWQRAGAPVVHDDGSPGIVA